jgi:hypothetical protein
MVKRGFADDMDMFRDDIEKQHPRIQIQDVDYYEFSTFNRVASENMAMISADCWSDAHPLLVTIPVNWEYAIPYGLIYAKTPTDKVLEFITAIGKINEDK